MVTRVIKNCLESEPFNGRSHFYLLCKLTRNHSQSATFHSVNPLTLILKSAFYQQKVLYLILSYDIIKKIIE